MFDRTMALIGKENLNKIKEKAVLIIGLGGVGGASVESLARSGIKKLIIVDYDFIDLSNVNRQIIALSNTIGKKKTDVFAKRLKLINPNIEVNIIDKKIDDTNYIELFKYNFDYLIDACDTINTKKIIIEECLKRKIKFISCMGTARKIDPTKLSITELNKTSYDKIAKILRKWAIDKKINNKIKVVSSNESCINTNNEVLGSIVFVPFTAGLLCAKYVIDDICK